MSEKLYLKGSTIIEVITAILLITIALTLAAGLFSKTIGNSNLYVKHQAISTLDALVVQNILENHFVPEVLEYEDFQIRVSLLPFREHDSLSIISFTAVLKSSEKQIYSRKLLKYYRNN